MCGETERRPAERSEARDAQRRMGFLAREGLCGVMVALDQMCYGLLCRGV